MKVLFLILAVVGLSLGQSAYNVRIYQYAVGTFAADSLKATSWFPAGDAEGVDIVVKSSIKDSAVFQLGYQRGYWDGGQVISKRPFAVIDTFNTLTAGNFIAAGTSVSNFANDTDVAQALDTAVVGGYATMARHFWAYRSPYARITLKGLTGNKHSTYNIFVTVNQPKAINVDPVQK